MVPYTDDSFVKKLTRKIEKYKSKIAFNKGVKNYCTLHFNEVMTKINSEVHCYHKKINKYRSTLGLKTDQPSEEETLLESATSSEGEDGFEIKEETEFPKMPKMRKRKVKGIIPDYLSKRVRINDCEVIPIQAGTNIQYDLLSQTLNESGISFDNEAYTFKQEEPEWDPQDFLSNEQFPILELQGQPVTNTVPVNITGIKDKDLGNNMCITVGDKTYERKIEIMKGNTDKIQESKQGKQYQHTSEIKRTSRGKFVPKDDHHNDLSTAIQRQEKYVEWKNSFQRNHLIAKLNNGKNKTFVKSTIWWNLDKVHKTIDIGTLIGFVRSNVQNLSVPNGIWYINDKMCKNIRSKHADLFLKLFEDIVQDAIHGAMMLHDHRMKYDEMVKNHAEPNLMVRLMTCIEGTLNSLTSLFNQDVCYVHDSRLGETYLVFGSQGKTLFPVPKMETLSQALSLKKSHERTKWVTIVSKIFKSPQLYPNFHSRVRYTHQEYQKDHDFIKFSIQYHKDCLKYNYIENTLFDYELFRPTFKYNFQPKNPYRPNHGLCNYFKRNFVRALIGNPDLFKLEKSIEIIINDINDGAYIIVNGKKDVQYEV